MLIGNVSHRLEMRVESRLGCDSPPYDSLLNFKATAEVSDNTLNLG
jgi:hypothetical protein